MFGSSATNSNNTSGSGFSFGGASKPAFSFGTNPATTTTANPSATATATATAPAPAPASSGFSFNKPASTTAGTTSSFGFGGTSAAPAAAPAATSGGFSFGAKPAATSGALTLSGTTSNQPSGFNLGQTSATSNQPSGFNLGQPTTATAAQQSTPTSAPAPAPAPSFNSQPSFSWSKPAQTQTQTQINQPNQSQFQLQQQQLQQPQQQQQQQLFQTQAQTNFTTNQQSARDYTPTINDKLTKVKTSWDASNPQCPMVSHFYNKVDPSFNNFTRPIDESPEEWEDAMKNRPKEYNSIPIKCKGFTDLFERNKLQDSHVKQTRFLLKDINDKLTNLNEKHDLHSNAMLIKCKMRQKNLSIKLLKIAINLSILKYKGYPLTNDEELLISRFNSLLAKLDDPVGLNRVNELWARLSSLKDKYSSLDGTTPIESKVSKEHDGINSTTDVNTEVIRKLVKILGKQQQGIQFLCELMEEDEAKLQRFI